MTRKWAERQESIEQLRKWLEPGDTVYTILRHVRRTGMNRKIEPILIERDLSPNPVSHIGYHVGRAIDHRTDDHSVTMQGCGMDMGCELVYVLSYNLWPDGFDCIGDGCPSNDHNNRSCVCNHRTNHNRANCPKCDPNGLQHTQMGPTRTCLHCLTPLRTIL